MSRFLSEKFRDITPYTPGEQPKNEVYIKLNTNESPFPPSPEVKKAITGSQIDDLRLYSDPEATGLVNAIAQNYGVNAENVLVTNGSDEALAFAFLAFGGDKPFAFPSISYGFYKVFARLFSVKARQVPLTKNFEINTNDYLTNGENVCIANPNAPTGIGVETVKIEEILTAHKNDIVIIDEAYVDFGAVSVIPLCKKYDNLLVIGTFSKSRNLAGARIGFAIANAQIIADLNKMKFSFNPYNVNRLSMVIGTKSMEDKAYFATCTQKIIDARKTTTKELEKIGFEVLPSSANFIFAKNDKISGEKLFKKLKENKILVRFFNEEPIKDYLRITIGTDNQMEIFVNTVKKILAENDNL